MSKVNRDGRLGSGDWLSFAIFELKVREATERAEGSITIRMEEAQELINAWIRHSCTHSRTRVEVEIIEISGKNLKVGKKFCDQCGCRLSDPRGTVIPEGH